MIRLTSPLLPDLKTMLPLLEEIWADAWLTNRGRKVQLLEERLRGQLRCGHLQLFCNGTIALLLGLKVMRLTGEVITTPFTFPATVHALDWAGLKPVFADVDPATLCIDPCRVEEAITPRTSAILAVHVFGIPCDVHALAAIARKHGLKLIYDAAHAFGTEIDGVPISDYGDMSMFSFHATKLFHTAEGGALVYKDGTFATTLHHLHNFGIANEDEVLLSGINGKMNEIQAALGLCTLDLLKEEREKRDTVIARYRYNLGNSADLRLLLPGGNVLPSYQYMPILFHSGSRWSRDEVFRRLRKHQIMARRYFRPLCSKIACYRDLSSAVPENLPCAESAEKNVLCLPLYGDLTPSEVDQVCEVILSGADLEPVPEPLFA